MRMKRKSTLKRNLEVKVHSSEPAPCHCGRSHHNWCGHVCRSAELKPCYEQGKLVRAEAPGKTSLEPLLLFGVVCSG